MKGKHASVLLGLATIGALVLVVVVGTSVFAQGTAPGRAAPGRGPRMMRGWGMMGGFGGCPLVGGTCRGPAGAPGLSDKRISNDQVERAAQGYLDAYYPDSDLKIAEIMEFQQNFYAQIAKESTRVNALELLIGPYTGAVWPEYGPNMMWNTRYGHHAGMMGIWGGRSQVSPSTDMPVTLIKAQKAAQQYLDNGQTRLTAGDPETFYGYYTIHTFDEDGNVIGMLSVHGYTSQVCYHIWHGDFVRMISETE